MKVKGREYPWEKGLTVKKLLKQLEYSHPAIILSVNDEMIPKEDYGRMELKETDEVKIVHPIVGG